MKNTLVWCCISYILGILLLHNLSLSVLPAVTAVVVIAIALKVLFFKGGRNIWHILIIICFLAGGLSANHASDITLKDTYTFTDQYVVLTGRVEEVTEYDLYDRYVVRGSGIASMGGETAIDEKIDVRLYRTAGDKPYQYGDIITVDGMVSVPRGPMNSGDMDYVKWRNTEGIFVEMTGEYADTQYLSHQTNWWNIYDTAYNVREFVAQTVDRYLEGDVAALMRGILISDDRGMSVQARSDIEVSGVAHITTVSGMHVNYLLMILFWILFSFKLRRRYVYLISMVFLGFLAFVQGCTPPVVRAVIMGLTVMFAGLTGRNEDRKTSLAFAALVILIFNPLALFSVSFQLSFLSMVGITVFYAPMQRVLGRYIKSKWLSAGIAITAAVQICIAPALAYYFGYLSLYVVLSNLLISPVLPLILTMGMLLAVFSCIWGGLCVAVAFLLRIPLGYILGLTDIISKLPFARINTAMPGAAFMTVYAGVCYLIYIYINGRKRRFVPVVCGICAGILCVSVGIWWVERDVMDITFINVGQGDAALIQTPSSHVILIDGGGSPPYSKADVGKELFVPYLMRKGIDVVDMAIVSHYDKDHAQGIVAAVEMLDVKMLMLPYRREDDENTYRQKLELLAEQKEIPIYYMEAGKRIDLGEDISMDVLAPAPSLVEDYRINENNNSVVINLRYGEMDFLFAGDIEELAEEELLFSGAPLAAEVLKVPHHGSSTSSTREFIEAVSPKIAVIDVGERNAYSHPSPQTLETLEEYGARVYRTDINGDMTFRVRKDQIFDIRVFRVQ